MAKAKAAAGTPAGTGKAKVVRAGRVLWSPEETQMVATEAFERLKRGAHLAEAAEEAMRAVLPQGRWRSFKSKTPVLKNLRPYLDALQKGAQADNATAAQSAALRPARAPDAPAPADALPAAAAPALAPDEGAQAPQLAPRWGWRDVIVDMAREVLVQAVQDPRFRSAFVGFLSEIVPQTVEEIAGAFGARPKDNNRTPHVVPPKDNMETVAVVGLLPRQQQQVRDLYGAYFDLRFVEAGAHPPMIKGATRGASIVYLMADFIGHKDQELVKQLNAPVAYVNGATTALQEALENRLDLQKRRGNGQAVAH